MVDSIRQNPDMRDQLKCSECRKKKIKCTPRDRRYETTHQKCDNCKKYDNAPCGPNYKKRDDPACSKLPNEASANEKESTRGGEDQPRARPTLPPSPVHSAGSVDRHHGDEPSSVNEGTNGQRKRKITSDNWFAELHGEAASLLENLNSLGRSYAFGSELTPVHCRNQDNPVKYNKGPEDKMKAIKDEFHSLFIRIGQLGRQLHEQGMDKDASPIFKELMIALERYPGLGDDRKYNALCNIAEFYRVKGDQDEHEWVLTKAVEAHDPSIHPNDPCPLLAASFSETSRRAADDLLKLWNKNFMVAGETSLAIPPVPRSAQQGNAGIASILLDRPNSIAHSPPALFNQEGLHIAATRGYEQGLKNFLHAGAQVDAPDFHNHTALFLAAARGHEGCCAELISWEADVNRRDRHGTTILEVAAGAGHLKVVQRLVSAGAELNPECVCCTSTPLQAAIENPESPIEVALYLMGKDSDVSIQRKDGKNAIDLAKRRCAFLAKIMSQKELLGPQDLFGPPQTFSFDQRDLGFDPDLL